MRPRGFTLIELLLVLTLVALLASLVAPVVTGSISHAKESALKETLYTLRKAIDDYYADTGGYPADIDVLVQKRYLRKFPLDPFTGNKDSWVLVRADTAGDGKSGDGKSAGDGKGGGIIDVRNVSEEKGSNGVSYKEW